MECRPPQNNETKITENYRDEEENDQDVRFLSHEQLEEYKKMQEVLLKFSKEKTTNKSDLRKSLLNIAANLMRVLVILENAPNHESTSHGVKNSKANQQYKPYDNDKSSTPENEPIPNKKINRHLEQKNYKKDAQIPRVTIQKLCNNNKPACVGYTDRSLHENDECRIDMKKPDSRSAQYIQFSPRNDTQTLLQKNENCNTQLNNETEIVFECKNVEPTITLFAPQKLHYMSQNQLQDAKINEPTRATIKDERLDVVKKEYLHDNIEKLNSNNDSETNGENEIIPPLNSIHDSEESEKLETCPKKLEKNSNLKVHKDTTPDRITHSCEICEKKFTQKTKLEIHTKVLHNGRKFYKCDTCGKTFALKNKLARHINSIHIDTACDASRKTMTRKDYLQNHIDSVQNGQKRSYNCNTCGNAFTLKIALKKHIDLVHNGQKSDYRVSCGKKFKPKVAVKKHIDSARRSITHTCDSCGKTFKHKLSLQNHIDFVHKNVNRHKCDRCQKSFSSKSVLDRHMSSIHDGITYACDLCKKIFTQKSTLTVHVNTVHMNKRKLFKCDECLKTFNYKCHLTSHIEYAHKGITHPCDFCRKVFTRKDSLKEHKDSMHNGITHTCNQCKKSFTHRKSLQLHINQVHNGKK